MSEFSNITTVIILAIVAFVMGLVILYLSYKQFFNTRVLLMSFFIPCCFQLATTYLAYMTGFHANSPPAAFYLHLSIFISAGPLAAPGVFLAFFIIVSDQ